MLLPSISTRPSTKWPTIALSSLAIILCLLAATSSSLMHGARTPRAGSRRLKTTVVDRSPSRQELSVADEQLGEIRYSPVLLVPGDGGNQLEARLNKTTQVHYICTQKSDWYDLWLNIHLLAPVVIDCLIDNMRLSYNSTTRTTHNTEGVEIRASNFGSIDSVDFLDISKWPKTDYFSTIISTLEKSNGLIRNVDMIAAPFDFRKAPNELADYFQNLTMLIEDHYIRNNYRPVSIICHSMGCLNTVYLLNSKSQGWKDVYVRRLITLGAPWDGSFKAISAMLYGDDLGIILLNKGKMQSIQSTFPSLMYLFPKGPTFPENKVLVQTPNANYSLANLDKLFEAAGLLDQREMWHDTRVIAGNLTAPNVEIWCLYGAGVPTPSKIIYHGSIADGKYTELEEEDGDGTINLQSLRACEHLRAQQAKPVYTRQFDATDHIDILRNQAPADFISSSILVNDLYL